MFKFLTAFAKLEKTSVSFVMSVRLSARNNSASSGWIFMKVFFERVLYMKIFVHLR